MRKEKTVCRKVLAAMGGVERKYLTLLSFITLIGIAAMLVAMAL